MILEYLNDLNWIAVVVSTAAAFAIGFVWFAPPVLGAVWARQVATYTAIPEGEVTRNAARGSVLATWLVAIAVNVLVLALGIEATGANSWVDGVVLGAVLWLGFGAALASWPSIFARLPRTWLLLNWGSSLLMNVVAGAILGAWT